ncbi:MAG: tetratricopeptide repeat protein [Cyclobacteriaceae bacterium]
MNIQRRLTLFTLSLLGISCLINAQKIDSLQVQLSVATDSLEVADLCFEIYSNYTFNEAIVFKQAPDYLLRALRIYEVNEKFEKAAEVYNALGGLYYNRNLLQDARQNWVKSGELFNKANKQKGVAKSLNNIAVTYINDPKLKLEYLTKSISLSKQIGDSSGLAINFNNMGNHFLDIKDFDTAIEYYDSAIFLAESQNNMIRLQSSYYGLGRVKQDQGLTGKAIEYMEKSLNLKAKRASDPDVIDAYRALTEMYNAQGQHSKAFEYQQKWMYSKDTLNDQAISLKLWQLTTEYDAEKKEQELKLKDAELRASQAQVSQSETQRNAVIAVAVLLIVIVVTVVINRKKIVVQKDQILVQQRAINEANKKELEEQSRSLVSNSLLLAQKNQLLNDIKEHVENEVLPQANGASNSVRKLLSSIKMGMSLESEWEEFRMRFEKVHPEFFDKLQSNYPELTNNEQRLLAFLKLDLTQKQIASLLNVSAKGVEMAQYRIRKKLNLPSSEGLLSALKVSINS